MSDELRVDERITLLARDLYNELWSDTHKAVDVEQKVRRAELDVREFVHAYPERAHQFYMEFAVIAQNADDLSRLLEARDEGRKRVIHYAYLHGETDINGNFRRR